MMTNLISKITKLANLYAIASFLIFAQDIRSAFEQLYGLISDNELRQIFELYRGISEDYKSRVERVEAANYLSEIITEIKNNYADSPTIANLLDKIYNDATANVDFSDSARFEGLSEETSHEYHRVPIGKEEVMKKDLKAGEDYQKRKQRALDIYNNRKFDESFKEKRRNYQREKLQNSPEHKKRHTLLVLKRKYKKWIMELLLKHGYSESEAEKKILSEQKNIMKSMPMPEQLSDIDLDEINIEQTIMLLDLQYQALKKMYENLRNSESLISNLDAPSDNVSKGNLRVQKNRARNKARKIYLNRLINENPNTPRSELEEKVKSLSLSEVDEIYKQLVEEAKQKLST